MKNNIPKLIKFIGVVIVSSLFPFNSKPIMAQTIPDQSLGNESAIVIPFTEFIQLIQGGAIRGENLFQSFQDFNIAEGQDIIITNPDGVNNILIRVTGNNPSELLGALTSIKSETINNIFTKLPSLGDLSSLNLENLIGLQDIGTANLFFLNPNGILFGENASLNIGGSFIATTANQIKFSDGSVFSANINQSSPLLTVSTPIGLQFTQPHAKPIIVEGVEQPLTNLLQDFPRRDDTPEQISQLSTEILENLQNRPFGLTVFPGKTIALVGGNVTIDGGGITAFRGRIEIGSVINEGDVSLTPSLRGWTLGYEGVETLSQGNIDLSQLALMNTSDIDIDNNPEILSQISNKNGLEPEQIKIWLDITKDLGGGEIKIQGQKINLFDESAIISVTHNQNGGNIDIEGQEVNVVNGSIIGTATLSTGNSGSVIVETDTLTMQDFAYIGTTATDLGQAGSIRIDSKNVLMTNGSLLNAQTLAQGRSGNLTINASESIYLVGKETSISTAVLSSGEAGKIEIFTNNLNLDNSFISSASFGEGNSGSRGIEINTNFLSLLNGSEILATSFGGGNAGLIEINASEEIIIDGERSVNIIVDGEQINTLPSAIKSEHLSEVATDVEVTSEGIIINTKFLSLTNGGEISTSTFGEGNAGQITINASEEIIIDGEESDGFPSGIFSQVSDEKATGDSLGITINTSKIVLTNGGQIDASTFGKGDTGVIQITADEQITIDGEASDSFPSGIFSQVSDEKATGDSLGITINTSKIVLTNGGQIDASTFGKGDAGVIQITADEQITIDGETSDGFPSGIFSQLASGTSGNSEGIMINSTNIYLINGGEISASTFEKTQGEGGEINIKTNSLILENQGQIDTLSEGKGNAGNITLNINNSFTANDGQISANANQAGGGKITINAQNIRLRGDSDIRTNVNSGAGDGGNITVTADSIINFNDSDIFAFARDGRGGNIRLNTPIFFGDGYQPSDTVNDPNTLDGNGRVDLNATGAVSGAIIIPDLTYIQNNLVQLPESLINPESLIANTCVVPDSRQQGTFIIKGAGGLSTSPGKSSISPYPTGTVKPLPNTNDNQSWQKGDPIIEPQGVFKTTEGKLILSRQCP